MDAKSQSSLMAHAAVHEQIPASSRRRRLRTRDLAMRTAAADMPSSVGTEVDHRADLFSLGCVLSRMATGHLPFPGKSVTQQLTALMTQPLRPVQEWNVEVPDALADLIHQLLERDRDLRPSSAIAVRQTLQSIANGHPAARPSRRKKLAQQRTLIAMIAVALILSVGVFWFRRPTDLPANPVGNQLASRSTTADFTSVWTGHMGNSFEGDED